MTVVMTIYDPIIHYYIVTPRAGSITVPVEQLRRFNHRRLVAWATITASATNKNRRFKASKTMLQQLL